MTDETRTAGGVPVVAAEPVGSPREPILCLGSWIDHVERRAGLAVLGRRSGAMSFAVDEEFVRKAALALDIRLAR